jgi:hypothetical protein
MTTDFLARTAEERGARVYSCEIDDRHFGIASRTRTGTNIFPCGMNS